MILFQTVNARKERRSLKEQLKKQLAALRQEKKKYRLLQKEVDKMAKLMREGADSDGKTINVFFSIIKTGCWAISQSL